MSSFDERFFEDYVGPKMATDPITAVVELIANSWDAGARNVYIDWPISGKESFSLADDGHGLTAFDFSNRWTQLSYNRLRGQGESVEIPTDNSIKNNRIAYGRNGKGRFSAFCFTEQEYFVETKRDLEHNCFAVRMSSGEQPFKYNKVNLPRPSKLIHQHHGTTVFVNSLKHIGITEGKVRSEIGLRFLTDPDFKVKLNGKTIKFNDIDKSKVKELSFEFSGNTVIIKAIQTDKSDKTTQQHGIAWHANGRLVGQCSWNGFRNDSILDGRTSFAKSYTFIVDATLLVEAIKSDWSGFETTDYALNFYDLVKSTISEYLQGFSRAHRIETTRRLRDNNRVTLDKVGLIGNSRWNSFIEKVQEMCPRINDQELDAVACILANLEASTYQYSLVHKLKEFTSNQLDDFKVLLDEWNLSSAKAVLDEVKSRLTLVEAIREKVRNTNTLEVQELQPLFKKGLWIFGPEFESIEYSSNEGMTRVIVDLFKLEKSGSRNRPDFIILKDSTVSLHGCYEYDDSGFEIGVKKVIIVELKKPGIPLGDKEKAQCWKYAKELYSVGAVLQTAKIECYLLGDQIEEGESGVDTKRDGDVRIVPMVYSTVLKRAESRLLNLHKKIKNAPFLEQQEIEDFLAKNTVKIYKQMTMNIDKIV
ncbi:hypothetical protein WG68_10370 [Arsukibacterium ikkense]|uniref:DNA mismatch repair protein n=2 Tax=Arsukibacterium ikkense TaxID=336831 RepID=A0A0M2V4F7_9GAMM|nr:hypothetical protein WG68_10370 [Arsukibacterium ikkense]